MIRLALAVAALIASTAVGANEPAGLHAALDTLSREGKFSGAVVVRRAGGVRFARGYGYSDPVTQRAFTPDTSVDSGSLAKPVTAAAVLLLVRDGRIDLDSPVERYLPEYPHRATTVRHLLAHSAGLALEESPEALAGKTNSALLAQAGGRAPLFRPGSAFTYCNGCYSTLAMLIEHVSGVHYLDFVQRRALLPPGVTLRPARLADWKGRAIGYRRTQDGRIERFDSWEGEAFYGSANFSLSAAQLARWGAEWWKPRLARIKVIATRPAQIAGKPSGLTLGSWNCAPPGRRCYYGGHHEGFHHMLYWDADRRISVAMVSNNTLAPALQQRLQRALVAFAEGRPEAAGRELINPLPAKEPQPGKYLLPGGRAIALEGDPRGIMSVEHAGVRYAAYPTGNGIRFVPGLGVYLAGAGSGLHWLSLYEDFIGTRGG